MFRELHDHVNNAVADKFEQYIIFFRAVSASSGYRYLQAEGSDFKLNSSELTLVFSLQEAFSRVRVEGDDYLISEINRLLLELLELNISIFKCDYLFVQALIRFLHDVLRSLADTAREDLDLNIALAGTAQLSLDLAESYEKLGTCYKDVERKEDWFDTYIKERNEKLFDLLSGLSDFATLSSRDDFIEQTVRVITSEYRSVEALDDEYKNLFEYFGILNYHGNDHSMYQTAIDELESRIYRALDDLSSPDLVVAMSDDIDSVIHEDGSEDIDSWDKFRHFITSSDEYYDLVKDIKNDFLRSVPEYFPD